MRTVHILFILVGILFLLIPCCADERPLAKGRVSEFGGPHDRGVGPREGLALLEKPDILNPLFKALFLPFQPKGTSGLARRLNPEAKYVAVRWNYKHIPREKLKRMRVLVSANGKTVVARPVDWGPARWTRRVADLSPGVMKALGLETDDVATITLVDEEEV